MMQKYDSYKDSGIQWLGEIPIHWEVKRIASLGFFSKGGGFSRNDLVEDDGLPAILYGDIYTKYNIEASKIISKVKYEVKKYSILAHKGDLLMTGSGETKEDIGKTIVLETDSYIGGDIIRFSQKGHDSKFLSYFLNSQYAKAFRFRESKGEIIVHIYASALKSMYISLPPLSEQQAIASYLDTATAKIDTAIAQQQKMIDLLNERKQIIINNAVTKGLNPNVKMKDSGVEWIGNIPEHWEVKKLKHVTSKIGSGSTPRGGAEVYQDSGVMFLRSQNIYNDGLRLDDVAHIVDGVHQKMKGTQVKCGDILYNITGGSIGRCCCYDIENEANVNQHVSIVRPQGIIAKYLMYNLQSDNTQRQLRETLKGGNREGLAAASFKEFLIPTCPKEEQIQIVSQIEKMFVNIDQAIANASKQIALLQERKQIIINDVVTGKVKVC